MNNKEETSACSMLIVGPPKQGKSPMMTAEVERFRDVFGESVTVDIIASKDGCYDIERLSASLTSLVGEIGRRSEEDSSRPHVLACTLVMKHKETAMKKFFAILALCLAFSLSSSAQLNVQKPTTETILSVRNGYASL